MRVVFVIDSLGSGGAQRQLVLVFNALRAKGVDAWLVYYQPHHHFRDAIDEASRGRVLFVSPHTPGVAGITSVLRTAIRRLQPDTVVSFLRGTSTAVGAIRAMGAAFRWIASERAGQFAPAGLARSTAYLAAIRTADTVVPNSHAMGKALVARGIPQRRVHVIPNGITLDPMALQAPLDRPHSPVRLLMVGTRVPEKNHPAVIEALGQLGSDAWELDHLGRTGENTEQDRAVRKQVQSHKLGARVHEHGRQSDLGRWYSKANLLIHPSLSEGFPNVVLEAWAWGCPVLVSDRGDLPHIVRDGQTGIVAPIGRRNGLRDALQAAISDPKALQRLAEAGRHNVVTHYAIEAVAERWLDCIARPPESVGERVRGRLESAWEYGASWLPNREE